MSGARIETGDLKKDPLDFALWKGEPEGEFGWPSPWGNGRPGWHIECSAMSSKILGPQFDIHGGGMDLMFPHHENEIAQSEAAHPDHVPFSKVWMHAGFLEVDSEKMSKSLGNFVTIRDVLARNDAEALRYFYLGTHYRGPLSFDLDKKEDGRIAFPGVDEAERRIEYLYNTREALMQLADGKEAAIGNVLQGQAKVVEETPAKVLSLLDRDLNTPQALAAIGELAKAGNEIVMQAKKLAKDPAIFQAVRALATAAVHALDGSVKPLGLMQASYEQFTSRTRTRRLGIHGLHAASIDAQVAARTEARNAKDFAKADALRKELTTLGIEVLDGVDGASSWRVLL
jgi:cysteinyl-tRNA synthetase